MPKISKLHCVSVCVNYADFFQHVIKENHSFFEKWIIVTDKKDTEVSALCEGYKNVKVVKTDVFYERGIFNKYAGINEGLKEVDKDAWILFLDSDIVLHPKTRYILNNLNLDEEFLYGIDRVNCVGAAKWEEYKNGPGMVRNNWLLLPSVNGMEFGARLVHYYGHEGGDGKFAGWNPLGFFQLCHHSQFDTYPENTVGADHCDLLFAIQWHRNKRVLIPEILAVHLESVHANKGVNWHGRKSLPFVLEIKKN